MKTVQLTQDECDLIYITLSRKAEMINNELRNKKDVDMDLIKFRDKLDTILIKFYVPTEERK